MANFLAENFWYLFAAVFVAGTALLWRTKFQRSWIIFLIRTKRGLWLLDRLAGISPRLWTSMADLSIILSFGSLGTLYVSRYRSPRPFLLFLGAIAVVFMLPLLGSIPAFALPVGGVSLTGLHLAGALFGLLLLALFFSGSLPPRTKGRVHAILTAAILFGIFFGFAGTLRPGPQAVGISALTGVFGFPGLLVSSLASQAASILTLQSSTPGISPLLPGVSPQGQIGFVFPGLNIFIPLWSGLAALIILLVSHEFCHGILARVHQIKVNTMGLLTAGPLPIGAFVEPDDKILETKRSEQKMHVYAMGSFANLAVAVLSSILFIVLSFQLADMVQPVGVEVASVQKGLPAEVLLPGTVIHAVNGVPVTTVEEYLNQSASLAPGDAITLATSNGTFTLTSVANPANASKAHLGFSLRTRTDLKPAFEPQRALFSLLVGLGSALEVIFFLNLNVAIVNLLPVVPFDGSKMFEELLKHFNVPPARRRRIMTGVIWIVVLLLALNALPLGGLLIERLLL